MKVKDLFQEMVEEFQVSNSSLGEVGIETESIERIYCHAESGLQIQVSVFENDSKDDDLDIDEETDGEQATALWWHGNS